MLACGALIAQAQDTRPRNEIEVRGTISLPSGDANFSGTSGAPNLDFARDFDFNNELGFQIRYTYRSENRKHKFSAEYDQTNWERNTTLSRSFTFRGETYVANANIDSHLQLRTFRAMYAYRWGNEKFRIGPMVDMGLVSPSLQITGTTNNGTRTAEGSINKFAATVGYDIDWDPTPQVNIFNNLGVISFKKDRLFHTEAGAKFFPSRHFGAVGGYKFQRYKFDDDPDFLRINSHGPFFGGVFRF
jgi:Outer membrane protein beta-barrel domain